MRICIDIGHPAHVHYFRNFIAEMKNRGHEFLITARDKEVSFALLDYYNIPYVSRGKGRKSFTGKIWYLLEGDFRVWRAARKFKPDVFLSFASPYAAHAAFFCRKCHVAIDDTEVAKFGQLFYKPFTRKILTPQSFKKDFGKKQIRFNSFMELCALHPDIFVPDVSVLKDLGLEKNDEYAIIRIVSWNANHDFGQHGIEISTLSEIITKLKFKYKILISAEGVLPDIFQDYRFSLHPVRMHHALAFASLYIGEGATMASECAMLGVPSIYINPLNAGTIAKQEEMKLLYHFTNGEQALQNIDKLLKDENLKNDTKRNRDKMLESMIDPTPFLISFIENRAYLK